MADELMMRVRRVAVAYWRWNRTNWQAVRTRAPETLGALLVAATCVCVATGRPEAAWGMAAGSVALWAAVTVAR